MVQYKNKIVKALASADRLFTIMATSAFSGAKTEKSQPSNMKKGAPGG
jgi:hypothetical protein